MKVIAIFALFASASARHHSSLRRLDTTLVKFVDEDVAPTQDDMVRNLGSQGAFVASHKLDSDNLGGQQQFKEQGLVKEALNQEPSLREVLPADIGFIQHQFMPANIDEYHDQLSKELNIEKYSKKGYLIDSNVDIATFAPNVKKGSEDMKAFLNTIPNDTEAADKAEDSAEDAEVAPKV